MLLDRFRHVGKSTARSLMVWQFHVVDHEPALCFADVSITSVLKQSVQRNFTPQYRCLLIVCLFRLLGPLPYEEESGMSSIRTQDSVPYLAEEVEVGIKVQRWSFIPSI